MYTHVYTCSVRNDSTVCHVSLEARGVLQTNALIVRLAVFCGCARRAGFVISYSFLCLVQKALPWKNSLFNPFFSRVGKHPAL